MSQRNSIFSAMRGIKRFTLLVVVILFMTILAASVFGADRFVFSEKTVKDTNTGLVWTRDASLGGDLNWTDASKLVKELNQKKYGGFNDWRLPSKKELETLVIFSKESGYDAMSDRKLYEFFNKKGFYNIQADAYWSSNADPNEPGWAYVVSMINGNSAGTSSISNPFGNAWAVRGGNPSNSIVPEMASHLNNLADSIYQNEHGKRSKDIIKKEILKRVNISNANKLAMDDLNKGDLSTARSMAEVAIAGAKDPNFIGVGVLPEEAVTYHILGNIDLQENNTNSAVTNYKHATEIDPNYAIPFYLLGIIYSSQGNTKLGESYLNKAFKLDPSLIAQAQELAKNKKY